MKRTVELISPTGAAAPLPVTLDQAKRHLAVSINDRDRDIELAIRAAAGYLGRITGRAWLTAHYALRMDGFPVEIELPYPPLQAVESIRYWSAAGTLTDLAANQYQVFGGGDLAARVRAAPGVAWPATEAGRLSAVEIRFRAGYGDPEEVPAELVQAVLLLVRHWYDNPAAVVTQGTSKEVELGVKSLVRALGTGFYANV